MVSGVWRLGGRGLVWQGAKGSIIPKVKVGR